MMTRLTVIVGLHTLAIRRHLRMRRIGHAAHYLAIIGVVVLICLIIGLVVLAVIHRRGKAGPEG